ncbi:glycoside hydrolase domain-containing protein [Microbacterium sp. M1A1_1b]
MHLSRRSALLGLTASLPLASAAIAAPANAATTAPDATPPTTPPPTSSSAPAGVLGVQQWLNATFGKVTGWVHVVEDGTSGSGTVLGLVQATQSLLGITPVVPVFGAQTRQRLDEHGDIGGESGESGASSTSGPNTSDTSPSDTDHDAATWRRLVQAGLICKGATAVSLTGEWDATTTAALATLRDALGATPGTLPVSPHLYGALLTTDAVTLAPGGSPTIRTVQQYLNRTYAERPGGAYGGTNGLVDVTTTAAVVRAVQIGSGAAAGSVDGLWGPGTAKALRAVTASVVGPGSTGPWVHLVKALLVLNRERVPFDDVYTAADAQVVRAFQQFQAFPPAQQTGTCDFGTWAALAASSGDAARATTGADMSTPLDAARAAAVTASGVSIVGRYLTNLDKPGALDKAMTRAEVATIARAGLGLWPIFEEGGTAASWFTFAQGIADAHRAHDAARQLGIPKQTTVYFAVDYDATDDDIETKVVPYFRGVTKGLRDRGGLVKPGVYGARRTCTVVSNAGLAHCSFVAGTTTGWAGNQLQPLPRNWSFNQIQERTAGSGASAVDIDANVVSGRDPGVTAAQLLGH